MSFDPHCLAVPPQARLLAAPVLAAPVLAAPAPSAVDVAHLALRDTLLGLGAARPGGARGPAGEDVARDAVRAAATTYARALRRDGMGLPAALVTVRATVLEGAALLTFASATRARRDAARCCLTVFSAH